MRNSPIPVPRAFFLALALEVLAVCGGSCATAPGSLSDGRESFASADAAVEALVSALRANDPTQVEAILGPEASDLLDSGDEVADQNALEGFLAAYDLRHDIVLDGDSRALLDVGADAWEMPIPLVAVDGSWYFDTESGIDEILARRIGSNEIAVILVCRAIVDAQREYAQTTPPDASGVHEYAQKFLSTPGSHDGLYWETLEGEAPSPLGPLVAEAEAEGYSIPEQDSNAEPERQPFYGYYYRMLTSQGSAAPGGARSFLNDGRMTGGFAVIAWPAEYDNSGIMSFLVSDDGLVYQKDLGDDTERLANAMSTFDPGAGWEIVTD